MSAKKWILGFGAALVVIGGAGTYWVRTNRSASDPAPEVSAVPSSNPNIAENGIAGEPDTSQLPEIGAPETGPENPSGAVDLTPDSNGLSRTTIVIQTEKGLIKFKLYPQEAPNTVNRIVELVQAGFYNGLTFHRVEPGFVIQGGDPQGTGRGGTGTKLSAEFNERKHVEGTLAMARTQDPDSADSQFYITLGPQPDLDRKYTVFGQVIEGMDVVRKIAIGDKMSRVFIQ